MSPLILPALAIGLILCAFCILVRNYYRRRYWLEARRLFTGLFSTLNSTETSRKDRAQLYAGSLYIPMQLEGTDFVSSSLNTKPGGFLRGKRLISPLNSTGYTARLLNTSRDFLRDNALTETHILKGERYIEKAQPSEEVDPYGLAYGEIRFEGFSKLLAITQPKAGETFYDLGAGAGKAVFCAALLYPWKKCVGIEILPGLYQESLAQLEKFQAQTKKHALAQNTIQFIHADLLSQDISDADVIFINATTFYDGFWKHIVQKINTLKKGTRLIIGSKRLPEESHYQLLDAQMIPMTWGVGSVYVYQKTSL